MSLASCSWLPCLPLYLVPPPPPVPPAFRCRPPCTDPAPCAPCLPWPILLLSPRCFLPSSPSIASFCFPLVFAASGTRSPCCPAFALYPSPCCPAVPPDACLSGCPLLPPPRVPQLAPSCLLVLPLWPSTWLTAAPPPCSRLSSFPLRPSLSHLQLQLVNDFWLRRRF